MATSELSLLQTGITGLDTLLGGGLPIGSLVMVVGAPGTGKTLMLQQLCFNWARHFARIDQAELNSSKRPKGKSKIPPTKALYFSTLSEPHQKLLQHIGQFQFFEEAVLSDHIKLFSLTGAMQQGLDQVAATILETVRQERPKLVTIDGFAALEALEEKPLETRRLLYQLSGQLGALGITTFLALERSLPVEGIGQSIAEELTIGDGVIYLSSRLEGARSVRRIEVRKLRGMNILTGQHAYQISTEGLTFYPRLESVTSPNLHSGFSVNDNRRLGFGLPELEKMLEGGVPIASSTVVAGSPGAGKTSLGLHYLMDGVSQGEHGLYVGFHDAREQLFKKAQKFGLDLSSAIDREQVAMLNLTPVELEPDRVMSQIHQIITSKQIQRVVIDGVTELEIACRPQQRSRGFMAALVNYFKGEGITSLYTHEISKLIGLELDLSDNIFTPLAENLLLLKQVEYKAQLYRVLAVLKMRDSDYDTTIRQFTINVPGGIKVLEQLQSSEGILVGLARELRQN